jgi:hypothetical protein
MKSRSPKHSKAAARLGSALSPSLIALGVTVLFVFRFARRELRRRTVRARTLWIRPAILLAITLYLVVLSAQLDPFGDGELFGALAVGSLLGVVVGVLIVRNTRFSPAPVPHAVSVIGNPVTFAIWVGALAIRLLARYALPHGADPRAQLPLNCGTVVMTTVAFIVIALAMWSEIRRYGALATMGSPSAMEPGVSTRQ